MKKGIRQFRKCIRCNKAVREYYYKGKFKNYEKTCGSKECFVRKHLPVFYRIDKRTNCWNYQGVPTNGGYGRHRYFFIKHTGKIIPKGMTLDHLCKNKICMNPEHLEVVSLAENKQRASIKFNNDKIKEVRDLYKSGINQYLLAKKYKVNQSTVSRIVNELRWAKLKNSA